MPTSFDLITLESLQSFFEDNLDIMCAIDNKGNFIKVNSAWRDSLGYSLDDLKDIHVFDFIHEEQRESLEHFIIDTKDMKTNFMFDLNYKAKNGLYKTFECRVHRFKDFYFIFAKDISAWTDAQIMLRKSQSQMQKNLELQSLISNIAFNLISDEDFDSAICFSISEIGKFLGLSRILVFVDSLSTNTTCLKYSWIKDSLIDNICEDTIDYDIVHSYKTLFNNKHLIFTDDLNKLPFDLKTHLHINDVHSLAAFPLYLDGHIRGLVRFDCCHDAYAWHPSTIQSLKTFTRLISSSYDKFISSVKLKESRKSLDTFFTNSKDGFFFMMLDEPIIWNDYIDKDEIIEYVFNHQRITKANQAILDQYNSTEEKFLGTTPTDFYKDNLNHAKAMWKKLFDEGVLHIDGIIPSHYGESTIIQGDYVCLYDESGKITGHFGIQRDMTIERNSQNKIAQSEMRFLQLAENIEEIFWVRENDTITYVNSAFEKVTGMSAALLDDDPSLVYGAIIEEDRPKYYSALNRSPNKFDLRYRIRKADGEIKWIWERGSTFKCPITNVTRSVGVSADITHMKELEEELKITATIDSLTQIYNRRYVFDRLEEISDDYTKNKTVFSFAILDIDFFKKVNDNYGHTAGDFILKEFASVIGENIRSSDILGRYGGEEFVIVLRGTDKNNATIVVKNILEIIRAKTFVYDDTEIKFTFSGGISDVTEFDSSKFTITELVNLADERLYEAKETGRNKIIYG